MTAILLRGAILAIIAYVGFAALLYVLQDRFVFPAPQNTAQLPAGFEAVELNTQDGLTLKAHWQAPDIGKPTVVWFHGNAGSLDGAAAETALLASKGYGTLLVEYRGYGGNPGSPSEQGFYLDGHAAMAFLTGNDITPDQTIIAGHSIGSGTAVEMTVAYSPAALILVSPFTSLPDVAAKSLSLLPVRTLMRHRFENKTKIATLTLPVLVLHGSDDAVVPFSQGEELSKAAPNGTFMGFEGAGHGLSFQPGAQLAQADWLVQNGL